MNKLVYNGSLAVGTAMVGLGAGLQWGVGVGLMVTGGLVLAATFAGAFLAIRSV
jgi:hypothetical protein